jgi:hypothetical protein
MNLPAQVFEAFPVTCMVLLAIVILSFSYVMIRRRIAIKIGDKELDVGVADSGDAPEVPHTDKV